MRRRTARAIGRHFERRLSVRENSASLDIWSASWVPASNVASPVISIVVLCASARRTPLHAALGRSRGSIEMRKRTEDQGKLKILEDTEYQYLFQCIGNHRGEAQPCMDWLRVRFLVLTTYENYLRIKMSHFSHNESAFWNTTFACSVYLR